MPKPPALDFGFEYDYRKLWTLDIPAEEVDISSLANNLDIPYLEKEGTDDWNLTPRELIKNWQHETSHYKKIQDADLSYPIEIYFHNGEWKILDGVHRYCRALLQGVAKIRVRRVRDEMIQYIRT